MPLAGDDTVLEIEGEAVRLRPSLRAGLRLDRAHGGLRALVQAIEAGSVTAFAAIIAECGQHPRPAHFLTQPGPEPIGARLARLMPAVIALVIELADVAPVGDTNPETNKAGSSRITLADAFAELFGIATGILGWSPADAWGATPAEIHAALDAHVAMIRAQNGIPDPRPPGPDMAELDRAGLAALKAM